MVRLPSRLLLLCLPWSLVSPAAADETDVFNFRVSTSALRDDNLFRVPDGGGLRPEMETINTTVLGVDFNKRLSLQQFIAHVSWVDTRYQNNSYLDAGALRYDARWNWAIGSRVQGEVAVDRASVQNSFADFQGLRQRNLRTTENQRLGLDFTVNPSWHVLGGVFRQTVSNDQLLTQESDFEADGASAGIRHTPASGNWLGFQSRRLEGRYTRRPFDPVLQFDNEFTQTGQEFSANWQLTGHSAFTGRLEYVDRKHPHFSARDFSGWTGQLGYQYQYSAKTTLTATYLRNLNAFQDPNSSYYVADDWVLGARWAATAKVAVSTRLGFSNRQYRGGVLSSPGREDDVTRASIDVSYQPERWLEVRGGVATEKRESTSPGMDYTNRQVFLSANARF